MDWIEQMDNPNTNLDFDRDISKILILELGGIGDVILSVPAILALRNRFQSAEMTVLTVPRSKDVLIRFSTPDRERRADGRGSFRLEVLDPESGILGPGGALSLFRRLRSQSFDLLVDLSAIESDLADFRRWGAVRFIRAGRSIGRGTDGRGSCFDRSAEEILISTEHEMERKLAVTDLLGARRPVSAPIFPVLENEREETSRFLDMFHIREDRLLVAVFPGGLASGKRWPARYFREAIRWLTDNLGAAVMVIGGPDCGEFARAVSADGSFERVIPATSLSLGESAALLSKCSLFLTNDSGPMHLAAALGVPTVAIFGRTNHARYLPLLPESRRELAFADPEKCSQGWKGGPRDECVEKDCDQPDCIAAVSVDEVISRMETLCSRIGLLYTTHAAHDRESLVKDPLPGSKTREGDPVTGIPAHVQKEALVETILYEETALQGERAGNEGISREDAGFITRRARQIARDLASGSDGPILDVACGKGYLIDDMARDGISAEHLWGIDLVMDQLTAARSRCGHSENLNDGSNKSGDGNGNPHLIRGDLSSMPFQSGVFSTSLCINTLLNLEGNGNMNGYLSEISRVTRPGGHVFVEVRNARNPLVLSRFVLGRVFRRIPLTVHRIGDVIEAGRESGLTLMARKPVGPLKSIFVYSYILDFVKKGQVSS